MNCDSCGKSIKGDKLIGGWKNHADRIWCPDCLRRSFVLRAVTIPVASPVPAEGQDLREAWKDLDESLKRCWANSTALANWATTELYKNDVIRTEDMKKLGKYPGKIYLYPGARRIVPTMDSTSVVALLRAVEGKYRARRYNLLWTRSESLPNYRYPFPYPVHNQSWKAQLGEHGELLVSARLDNARRVVRLRGGPEFARARKAVLQLINGKAIAGELAIYRANVSRNTNRIGIEGRKPGGGGRQYNRVMVKLVMWLPKPESSRDKSGTLFLTTGLSTFWHYRIGEEGMMQTLHADHLKRAEFVRKSVESHQNRLDRISDDQKYNRRASKRKRHWTNERREAWCLKQNHRVDTFIHQETIELAKIAERLKVERVVYDDSDQSYLEIFPWAAVREKLAYKLDERGIIFEHVGKSSKEEEVVEEEVAP